MSDRHYTEGRNLEIEHRWAHDRLERLPALAVELVRSKVDVIVTGFAPGAKAAQNATATIPIVFVAVGDPVGVGVVRSLAHPGGNMTGLTHISVDLTAKSTVLLKEVVPQLRRLAVLQNPESQIIPFKLKGVNEAARLLKLELQLFDTRSSNDFVSSFSTMREKSVDALLTLTDPVTFSHRNEIASFAAARRLPTMYEARDFVDAGGLMSYGANLADLWYRAAVYVDKILRGTKPVDLPVEQATRFDLVINMRTAKALGLTIPPSVLVRADHVIE